jgi:uncharacterized protein YcfJ
MKQFTKSLAVASVAAAAFALPATASASDYRKCKDTQAAIAGGLIGGSLGTVIGEEIAGHGDKTEGAIAGALIGGIIGAAVGDGASDCEKDGRVYRNGRVVSTAHTPVYQTAQYRGNQAYTRGHQPNHRGYNNRNRNDRGYNQGYTAQQHDRDLRQIDNQMDRLRAERRDLKRYSYQDRRTQRRLYNIGLRLDELKDERHRVKRAWDDRRQPRGRQGQTRRGHYHGQNLCYSDH